MANTELQQLHIRLSNELVTLENQAAVLGKTIASKRDALSLTKDHAPEVPKAPAPVASPAPAAAAK